MSESYPKIYFSSILYYDMDKSHKIGSRKKAQEEKKNK